MHVGKKALRLVAGLYLAVASWSDCLVQQDKFRTRAGTWFGVAGSWIAFDAIRRGFFVAIILVTTRLFHYLLR